MDPDEIVRSVGRGVLWLDEGPSRRWRLVWRKVRAVAIQTAHALVAKHNIHQISNLRQLRDV